MASAARLRKLDQERLVVEASYMDALIRALRDCVSGHWGLFSQNDGKLPAHLEARLIPETRKELDQIGSELVLIREQLGFLDLFPPMRRLNELRSQKGANQFGEPRLAELFLSELVEGKGK